MRRIGLPPDWDVGLGSMEAVLFYAPEIQSFEGTEASQGTGMGLLVSWHRLLQLCVLVVPWWYFHERITFLFNLQCLFFAVLCLLDFFLFRYFCFCMIKVLVITLLHFSSLFSIAGQ